MNWYDFTTEKEFILNGTAEVTVREPVDYIDFVKQTKQKLGMPHNVIGWLDIQKDIKGDN